MTVLSVCACFTARGPIWGEIVGGNVDPNDPGFEARISCRADCKYRVQSFGDALGEYKDVLKRCDTSDAALVSIPKCPRHAYRRDNSANVLIVMDELGKAQGAMEDKRLTKGRR